MVRFSRMRFIRARVRCGYAERYALVRSVLSPVVLKEDAVGKWVAVSVIDTFLASHIGTVENTKLLK